MKAIATLAFVSATLAASPVFAADSLYGEMPDYPANVQEPSQAQPRTRAEVMAELYAAPFDGTELGGMPDYPRSYLAAGHSTAPAKTRAQVKEELRAAVVAGTAPTGGIDYPNR